MSDQAKESQTGIPTINNEQAQQKLLHQKLLDDTAFTANLGEQKTENQLSGLTNSTNGRRLYAFGEGLSLTPHGMFQQFQHDWHHPKEFAAQLGTGFAFGVGMRMLLPKTGAARAVVGTAMTYFMAKDALKPLAKMWDEAGKAQDMAGLHKASQNLGDGLGTFAAHTSVAVGSGMLGEMSTGAMLGRFSSGRVYDAWKDNLWQKGQDKLLGRQSQPLTLPAEANTGGIAAGLPLSEQLGKISDAGVNSKIVGPVEPGAPKTDVPVVDSQLVDKLQNKVDARVAHEKLYRSHEFSNKIDALLEDKSAGEQTAAFEVNKVAGPEAQGERSSAASGRSDKSDKSGEPDSSTVSDITVDATADNGKGAKRKTGKSKEQPAEDPPALESAAAGKLSPELNSADVGNMAIAMRAAASKWTQEQMQIAQAKEDVAGPLIGAMRSGDAPLDVGHFPNNEMILDLNNSIKTMKDARQALPLLDYFRTANQQMEVANHGDGHGIASIRHLNQYSRSIQAFLLGRLNELGIPLDVVRGSNAPLFTNRNSDGAGPHTIPAIPGVTDAAVIVLPREYTGLEGVHISGVYPHEVGHDLVYGDLLRFPAELRDKILTEDVVGAAMKKSGIEDTVIDVPGSPNGTMKKSEFFAQLLKAEANENTADMFGTSIDPNTGLSLAVLLGSLRKPIGDPRAPGALETRSMYGDEFVDPKMGNSLGIEPHGIDRWRIKLTAQSLREIANGNKRVGEHADELDALANAMARPGDQYVWASMDNPGQSVSIPQKEWDSIIPHLVKAQLDTPLEALNGHKLRDLSPNMSEVFDRVDFLSDSMADAVLKGNAAMKDFDKSAYRIEDIYSAGLSGWRKAVERNALSENKIPVDTLMARINKLSFQLADKYVNDVPEEALPGGIAFARSLAKPMDAELKPQNFVARSMNAIDSQAKPVKFASKWAPGTVANAGSTLVNRGYESAMQDVMEHKRIQDQIFNG